MCKHQLRTAGPSNVPFAPDMTPIIQVMGIYGMKDRVTCLEKVMVAFDHFLAKENS